MSYFPFKVSQVVPSLITLCADLGGSKTPWAGLGPLFTAHPSASQQQTPAMGSEAFMETTLVGCFGVFCLFVFEMESPSYRPGWSVMV